jgi:hypothetical protein
MIKRIIHIVLFVFISCFGQAQNTPGSKEKIEAVKIGFISERLELNAKQAQTFWPLYTEYSAKKKEIKKAIKLLKVENAENETDAEIIEDFKKINQLKQKEVDIEKEYVDKFLTVLTPKQLAALYIAERDFTKKLLEQLKK